MTATLTDTTPRIYVACVASYNAGHLHGVWIDCDYLDEDDILEEIKEMLKESPEPIAEDWRIDDHENFKGWNPCKENLETIAEVAQAIAEHGDAIAVYLNNYQGQLDSFSEDYLGKYDSEEDFVEQRLDDDGTIKAVEDAGLNVSYIDFEAIARDWFCGSYSSYKAEGGKVHVFNNR